MTPLSLNSLFIRLRSLRLFSRSHKSHQSNLLRKKRKSRRNSRKRKLKSKQSLKWRPWIALRSSNTKLKPSKLLLPPDRAFLRKKMRPKKFLTKPLYPQLRILRPSLTFSLQHQNWNLEVLLKQQFKRLLKWWKCHNSFLLLLLLQLLPH